MKIIGVAGAIVGLFLCLLFLGFIICAFIIGKDK